jgi:hypothetical protein
VHPWTEPYAREKGKLSRFCAPLLSSVLPFGAVDLVLRPFYVVLDDTQRTPNTTGYV